MRSLITLAIVGVIPVLAIAMLWPRLAVAEQKTSPKARAKIATDVVVGEVSDTYAKTVTTERYGKGTVEKRSLIEVQVERVSRPTAIHPDKLAVDTAVGAVWVERVCNAEPTLESNRTRCSSLGQQSSMEPSWRRTLAQRNESRPRAPAVSPMRTDR